MNQLIFRLLLCSMLLNGCANQKMVNKLYPIWGEEIILSSGDNRNRHLQIQLPSQNNKVNACILMVHGMNEHIGRYAKIADYFAEDNIVAGIDLTAHGLSNPVFAKAHIQLNSGATEQDVTDAFLEQGQLSDLQPMRVDLEQALEYLTQRCDQFTKNEKTPVFILSHSLGSLVTASWLLQTENKLLKDRIAGIILSGPAFSITQIPGRRGWLQNPFVQFTFHTHQHFLNPHNEALPLMLFNQLLSLITVPIQYSLTELLSLPGMRNFFSPNTPDWVTEYLSNSEEERIRHTSDPYILRRTILRYVLAVGKEVIAFRQQMSEFDLPYLLIYSEHDPITPAWGNTDFISATYKNHSENEVMMLAGKNHHEQLFSTPELQQQILQKIRSWLVLRTSK